MTTAIILISVTAYSTENCVLGTVLILCWDLMKDEQTSDVSIASKYAAVPHACK